MEPARVPSTSGKAAPFQRSRANASGMEPLHAATMASVTAANPTLMVVAIKGSIDEERNALRRLLILFQGV